MGLICDGLELQAAHHRVPRPGGSADGMQPGDPIQVIIHIWHTLPPVVQWMFITDSLGSGAFLVPLEIIPIIETTLFNVTDSI